MCSGSSGGAECGAPDVGITGKPSRDDLLTAEPFVENEIVCIAGPNDQTESEGPVSGSG